MANPTDDDPFVELGRMTARDPDLQRLLKNLQELKEEHGAAGIDHFLGVAEEMLGIQAEPEADERRARFRVVPGGES